MLIQTERLQIRRLVAGDWRGMLAIAEDFRRSPYWIYDNPLPVAEDQLQPLVERFAASGLFFAVLLPGEAEIIGYVCFYNDGGKFDLGYAFHSDYHGKGYAYESCAALIGYLEREAGARIFSAGAALANRPSCRLLEKLGFELVGTEEISFHKDERGDDIVFEGGIFVLQARQVSG